MITVINSCFFRAAEYFESCIICQYRATPEHLTSTAARTAQMTMTFHSFSHSLIPPAAMEKFETFPYFCKN